MTVPYTPIVVNTGGKLVAHRYRHRRGDFGASKGAAGQFQTNLKAAGIDRNAVDTVVISHFHGDHVNGLLTADGKPAFPNAEILVPAVEWEYWTDDGEMSRAPAGRMQDLFKNNRRVFDALEAQGHALRVGQGGRARHHRRRDRRAYAGPHLLRRRLGQRARSSCSRT